MTFRQYSDLSNEMILMILGFIHPSDLDNFALISRRNHTISTQALALHRARKITLGTVSDADPLTIPSLLAQISAQPALAWYIRRLIVHSGSRSLAPCSSLHCGLSSDARLALIRNAVTQSPSLTAAVELDTWLDAISRCDDELFKIILLSYTANLRTLEDEITEEEAAQFYGNVSTLAYSYSSFLPELSEVKLGYRFEQVALPSTTAATVVSPSQLQQQQNTFSFGRDIGHMVLPLFGFRSLKTLHVDIELLKTSIWPERYALGSQPQEREEGSGLAGILPASLEMLKICGRLQEFMDPGVFLAWTVEQVVRRKEVGIGRARKAAMVLPRLRALCVASLAAAWDGGSRVRDAGDGEVELPHLRELRVVCKEKGVALADRVLHFEGEAGQNPCAVCAEGPASRRP